MDHGEWFLENRGSRKLFIFSGISSVCDWRDSRLQLLDAFLFSFELDKFLTVDQYLCFVSFPVWAVGRKTEGADCGAEKDWRGNQVKLN